MQVDQLDIMTWEGEGGAVLDYECDGFDIPFPVVVVIDDEDDEDGDDELGEDGDGELDIIGAYIPSVRETRGKQSDSRIFLFDSVKDLVSYCDPKRFAKLKADFVGKDLPKWDSVLASLSTVSHKDTATVKRFVDEIELMDLPVLKDRRRRTQFREDDGDEFDYDRFRGGQSYWRQCVREDTDGSTEVTIITDLTASAVQSSENLLWRGAAAIALTELLEAKGYTVELWVTFGSHVFKDKDYAARFGCCLKRTNDVIDTPTLVNSVSGWFFRTIGFTALETAVVECNEKRAEELGYPAPLNQDMKDAITKDENVIEISSVFTFNGAVSVLQNELTKLHTR